MAGGGLHLQGVFSLPSEMSTVPPLLHSASHGHNTIHHILEKII